MFAANPRAGVMLTASGEDVVTAIAVPGGDTTGMFSAAVLAEAVSLAADGSRVLVADVDADTAQVYDL